MLQTHPAFLDSPVVGLEDRPAETGLVRIFVSQVLEHAGSQSRETVIAVQGYVERLHKASDLHRRCYLLVQPKQSGALDYRGGPGANNPGISSPTRILFSLARDQPRVMGVV